MAPHREFLFRRIHRNSKCVVLSASSFLLFFFFLVVSFSSSLSSSSSPYIVFLLLSSSSFFLILLTLEVSTAVRKARALRPAGSGTGRHQSASMLKFGETSSLYCCSNSPSECILRILRIYLNLKT